MTVRLNLHDTLMRRASYARWRFVARRKLTALLDIPADTIAFVASRRACTNDDDAV